jgi:hypothetical protein
MIRRALPLALALASAFLVAGMGATGLAKVHELDARCDRAVTPEIMNSDNELKKEYYRMAKSSSFSIRGFFSTTLDSCVVYVVHDLSNRWNIHLLYEDAPVPLLGCDDTGVLTPINGRIVWERDFKRATLTRDKCLSAFNRKAGELNTPRWQPPH